MEFMQLIEARRSVRSYTGEAASEIQRAGIMKAAQAAPVGMGKFATLHLVDIRSASLLAKIDYAAAQEIGDPSARPLYGTPELVVVAADFGCGMPENVVYSNCAIVAEHMHQAAEDFGLGSVLIWGAIRALVKKPELVEELGLPEGFTPSCAVAFGKTNEPIGPKPVPLHRIPTSLID